jgi:hypothetical protein
MVTLNSVYFKYIKMLCKIFVKYILPILQVYPNHLNMYFLKLYLLYLLLLYIYINYMWKKNSILSLTKILK